VSMLARMSGTDSGSPLSMRIAPALVL